MAAPIVQAAQETTLNTPSTSHALVVPGTTVSGDRLLGIAVTGKNNVSPGTTWPSPWVELSDTTPPSEGQVTLSYAYREVSGSPPSSVTITTVNNTRCTAVIMRINGHDPATAPEVTTAVDTADPPSITPSWGNEEGLFGSAFSSNEDPFPIPAHPFTGNQHSVFGSATSVFTCTQVFTSASINPATWQTGGEPSGRSVLTFAVRGGGIVVPGSVYADNNPTATTLTNCADDHYDTTTDGMMDLLDPNGPRSNDDFCAAWWGKPFAKCFNEILLTERFVQLVRQASNHEDPSNNGTHYLKYLGGDVLDTCLVTQTGSDQNRRFWIGSDYYANSINAVNLSTNKFIATSSPIRNHITNEFKDSEVDTHSVTRVADALGAGFRTMAGANLTAAVAPNQTTYPTTIYGPVAISPSTVSSRMLYIGAWLTRYPGGGGVLDRSVNDSHILHINTSGTVSETATFDVGAGGKFYICDIVEDSTYDYVYGREYVPGIGNFTPSHFENFTTDTTYMTLARTPHGSLMSTEHTGGVFTTYQFWSGSVWQSSIANSARMKDTDGNDIAGDAGVAKLGTNSYMLVAQKYVEREKRCYKSTTPEGPWDHYVTVPAPPFGADYFGAGDERASLHTKIHTDFPAPDGYIMTMCASLATSPIGRHIIEAGTPYFVAVPEPGLDINPTTISAPATVQSLAQVQLVVQFVQPSVITIPGLSQEPSLTISLVFTQPSISAAATLHAPTMVLGQSTISLGVINAAVTVRTPSIFNVFTVIRSITQGSDDASEIPGSAPTIADSDLFANDVGVRIGFRFLDIQVPRSANVLTATISLVIGDGSKNDAEGIWYGQAADNPITFTTTDGDIDGRTVTSNSVSWTSNDLGATGDTVVTPNLEAIAEEILNRAGWSSGNSMVFILDHNSSVDKLDIAAFENVTYNQALLTINYLSSAALVTPGVITASTTVHAPSVGAIISPVAITVVTTMNTPVIALSLQFINLNRIDAGAFTWAPSVIGPATAVGIPITFRDSVSTASFIDPVSRAAFVDPNTIIGVTDNHDIVFQESS